MWWTAIVSLEHKCFISQWFLVIEGQDKPTAKRNLFKFLVKIRNSFHSKVDLCISGSFDTKEEAEISLEKYEIRQSEFN